LEKEIQGRLGLGRFFEKVYHLYSCGERVSRGTTWKKKKTLQKSEGGGVGWLSETTVSPSAYNYLKQVSLRGESSPTHKSHPEKRAETLKKERKTGGD